MSDLKKIVARIQQRLEAVGMNATEASRKAGLSGSAIYNLQRGAAGKIATKGANTTTLIKLAPVLKTTASWLAEGEGPETADGSIGAAIAYVVKLPVLSWVSAGTLKSPDAEIDLDGAKKIDVPGLDPNGKWIGLVVEGDSMNRISPPESTIAVNLLERRLIPNACYVIALEDGSASYKRYRPGNHQWHPVSTNKRHKPLTARDMAGATVIGRVRKTMLDM